MERNDEIDRLKARLQWDSGGPLAHLASEVTDALAARAKALNALIHPLFYSPERVLDRLSALIENAWTLRQVSRDPIQHGFVLNPRISDDLYG